jgi:hypothetical protein
MIKTLATLMLVAVIIGCTCVSENARSMGMGMMMGTSFGTSAGDTGAAAPPVDTDKRAPTHRRAHGHTRKPLPKHATLR